MESLREDGDEIGWGLGCSGKMRELRCDHTFKGVRRKVVVGLWLYSDAIDQERNRADIIDQQVSTTVQCGDQVSSLGPCEGFQE